MKFHFSFYKILTAALVSLFFASCASNESSKDTNNCTVKSIKTIQINSQTTKKRFRHTQFLSENGVGYFIAYSPDENIINFFNIKTGKKEKTINLLSEGPMRVSEIRSFEAISMNRIFALTDRSILKLDGKGNIIAYYSINTDNSDFHGHNFVSSHIYSDIMNDTKMIIIDTNRLIVALRSNLATNEDPQFYQESKLAVVNLKEKKITPLNVFYPQQYISEYYPFNKLLLTKNGDDIVYSFSSSTTIYKYNLVTKKNAEFILESEDIPSVAPFRGTQYDDAALKSYISTNSVYLSLTYDNYSDKYYLFHYGPFPLNISGNEGKSGYLFVTVLDENFKPLSTTNLKWDYQRYGSVFTPDGLMMYKPSNNEDLTDYTFLKFSCDE